MNLFEHVKHLHDCELYSDLKHLASIAMSLCDNNPDSEVMNLSQKYQCTVFYGNALYHLQEYHKAEDIYKKALHLRKAINKEKVKDKPSSSFELTDEVEVKYKIYECLMATKQCREAMVMLQGISSKQRTPKINLALAKLYIRVGMDRSAITSYKEVLRECPLALEAMTGLMSLGVKGPDVAALVMNGAPNTSDWLSLWIKGQAQLSQRDYMSSIATLSSLDNQSYLRDNTQLLNSLAEAKFCDGQYTQALALFQRIHALDPMQMTNMDLYSYLLAKDRKVKDLLKLSQQLLKITEQSAEPWISLGYYCLATRKVSKTIYFAQKANTLDPYNIEAFLLKGTALLELKKVDDATPHMKEALRLAPHRYEAYTGLIQCYMALYRHREALTWAGKAIKTLGTTARTLTLYASVLAKTPTVIAKAKPYLEKAMKLDPSFLEAVYIMVEILGQEQQYDKGIEILRKQLETHSTCRLHQMLAEFLTQTHEHQEALDQFSIALSLDPSNVRVREGMERVEKQNDMGLESAYDVGVEDMENSEEEEEFEGSDVESAWSDTEFS